MLKPLGHELRQVSGVIHALLYLSKFISDQEVSTLNCADSEQGKWNHSNLSFFMFTYLYVHMHGYTGQSATCGNSLLSCGSGELNSHCQGWWQVPLSSEAS